MTYQTKLEELIAKAKQLGISESQLKAASNRVEKSPWDFIIEIEYMINKILRGESLEE